MESFCFFFTGLDVGLLSQTTEQVVVRQVVALGAVQEDQTLHFGQRLVLIVGVLGAVEEVGHHLHQVLPLTEPLRTPLALKKSRKKLFIRPVLLLLLLLPATHLDIQVDEVVEQVEDAAADLFQQPLERGRLQVRVEHAQIAFVENTLKH